MRDTLNCGLEPYKPYYVLIFCSDSGNVPDAVEYVAIREYSDIEVRLENGVKRSKFFISEKCIWHPDPTCIRHCQITNFI